MSGIGPFAVTKEMVRDLGDETLRQLLANLLEAEARERGIDPAGIAVGGNQTANDGGVDAAIRWQGRPAPAGWLPRRTMLFQCKAEVMAAGDILREMRPGGQLRPLFDELAAGQGGYVVFSTNDVSELALATRLRAMRDAIGDHGGSAEILVDFYGADSIARWCNAHLGVALWLLERVGRPLAGWQPHGSWSAPGSANAAYILDSTDRATVDKSPITTAGAIRRAREHLARPGGAVRLIGLSGMGKTRFAEALFDERTDSGEPLAKAMAIYGDVGLDLGVGANALCAQLASSGVRAVLVADNCRAETHGQLAATVARAGSRTSVLTIDHDLLGDPPAGTLMIRLGDNSDEAILGLLAQRCPWLDHDARRHLTDFAGGNARIALRIVEGSRDGVDVASLNDTELLSRLFQSGRQDVDRTSRACADAASLVYAFFVDRADHEQIEHGVLSHLAGVAPDLFYQEIGRFLDFGLAQQRGPQRAIMPPPLANMLAAATIRRMDPEQLLTAFLSGPARLFTSFARRLGYLDREPRAVAIAERLLADGGALGDVAALAGERWRAFLRLAPAAPDAALAAIRRALRGSAAAELVDTSHSQRVELGRLLVKLAHDVERFAPAMLALAELVIAEGDGDSRHSVRDQFLQRFWPLLSRTLADQEQRLDLVARLLDDEREAARLLGVAALDAMLDARFSASADDRFGARSLASEWQPVGEGRYSRWCQAAFDRLAAAANAGGAEGAKARTAIAHNFRQHLDMGGEQLPLAAMRSVRGVGYWDQGWRAVNEALHFGRSNLSSGLLAEVSALERDLRPKTLEELFDAFVLGEPWRHWHPSGREKRSNRNVAAIAGRIGQEVERRGEAARFVGRALRATGQTSVYDFAKGLGRATAEPDRLWAAAYQDFVAGAGTTSAAVLAGILEGIAVFDPGWADARLDAALQDPALLPDIVLLHAGLIRGEETIRRFTAALRSGNVPATRFEALMYGGVSKAISGGVLATFLDELFVHPDGTGSAVQILHMRFFGDRQDKVALAPELIALGRRVLTDSRSYREDQNGRIAHDLDTIFKIVAAGDGGEALARDVCRALLSRRTSNSLERDFGQLAQTLLKRFPIVVLDELVGTDAPNRIVDRFFGGPFRDDDDQDGADGRLDAEIAMAWVATDPAGRALRLARYALYCVRDEERGGLVWSDLALRLIDIAPDPVAVLRAFEERFWSGSSSGSFTARFVRRRPLIAAMLHRGDRRVRSWAREAGERLEETIRSWDERDRRQESRFE